jgi:hypothetical protein
MYIHLFSSSVLEHLQQPYNRLTNRSLQNEEKKKKKKKKKAEEKVIHFNRGKVKHSTMQTR